MIFLLALLPATGLTIAGYLVLYAAHRSEGRMQGFGKYLGFWAFALAVLVLLSALFAAAHYRHGGWHGHRPAMGWHGPWVPRESDGLQPPVAPEGPPPPAQSSPGNAVPPPKP